MIWIRLVSVTITFLIVFLVAYGMYSYEMRGRKRVLQQLLEDEKIDMKTYQKYLKYK